MDKVKTSIILDKDLHTFLKIYAIKNDMDMSEVITKLLNKLKQEEKTRQRNNNKK